MIKIEASTLEEAYQKAACSLKCSVTELKIEVVQTPNKGFLGLFKRNAIVVAVRETKTNTSAEVVAKTVTKTKNVVQEQQTEKKPQKVAKKKVKSKNIEAPKEATRTPEKTKKETPKQKEKEHVVLNDTIMPMSFVSTQDDENEYDDISNYLADYDEEEADFCEDSQGQGICEIVGQVQKEINILFSKTCFKIESIEVSVHDEDTLLVEFKGEDAALLIGKEGYRYKALSYMLFNWLNTKYQVQLRLEIAEFLKNQEDAIEKYLVGVCENIEKDGRAQTKILDGVLIQIALNELRNRYPNKYVAIRSTRDGLKYIIVNDYHSN